MTKDTKDWFTSWFDSPYYHILYKDRNQEEARGFVDHLTAFLQLPKKAEILDLACGTGILTKQIAEKLPHAEIVGVDITKNYLEKAKNKLLSYQNISFIIQDAEKLNLGKKFDCITASYLPKYCTATILIKNCVDHLNSGGKIVLHDFTYPQNKLFQKLWNFYFKLLNLAGFFIPEWKQVFIDLPNLIRNTNWVREYEKAMNDCGLKIHKQDLTCGSSTIIVGTKII